MARQEECFLKNDTYTVDEETSVIVMLAQLNCIISIIVVSVIDN